MTDRRNECGVLDRFVDGVRSGEGRALVVRGEPGVGKTVLLEYLADRAGDARAQLAGGFGLAGGLAKTPGGTSQGPAERARVAHGLVGPPRRARVDLRTSCGGTSQSAPPHADRNTTARSA